MARPRSRAPDVASAATTNSSSRAAEELDSIERILFQERRSSDISFIPLKSCTFSTSGAAQSMHLASMVYRHKRNRAPQQNLEGGRTRAITNRKQMIPTGRLTLSRNLSYRMEPVPRGSSRSTSDHVLSFPSAFSTPDLQKNLRSELSDIFSDPNASIPAPCTGTKMKGRRQGSGRRSERGGGRSEMLYPSRMHEA